MIAERFVYIKYFLFLKTKPCKDIDDMPMAYEGRVWRITASNIPSIEDTGRSKAVKCKAAGYDLPRRRTYQVRRRARAYPRTQQVAAFYKSVAIFTARTDLSI